MSRPKKNEEPTVQTNADYIDSPNRIAENLTPTQALVRAIGDCSNVQTTRVNPHFRSKYFGLGDLLSQVKPILARYDLALLQIPNSNEERISIKTQILHGSSGHIFEFDTLGIKAAGINLQAQGSAMTYLKRYAIATILGVAGDDEQDDDGNAASRPIQHSAPKPQGQAAAQPKPAAWFIAAGITTPQAQEIAAELLRRKGWLGAGDGLQELDEAKVAALHQGRMLQTFVDAIRAQLETPKA
jgi:hypothetical protein